MTLILDSSLVADVSMDIITVGTTGTISDTRFSIFLSMIESRLSKDGLIEADPSGNTIIIQGNEWLAALLICDLITVGKTKEYGITGENFGGEYSYSKAAAAVTTKSNFLMRYEEELTQRKRGVQASSGVDREDKVIEFAKLSQGHVPEVTDSTQELVWRH